MDSDFDALSAHCVFTECSLIALYVVFNFFLSARWLLLTDLSLKDWEFQLRNGQTDRQTQIVTPKAPVGAKNMYMWGKVRIWNPRKLKSTFRGSDCIDSDFDALIALWLLYDCSLSALWVLYKCSLSAFWVLSDCSLSALWVLILIWPRKMKIDCSRQTWTGRTNKRTNEDQHFLSSCRSQKSVQ